MNRSTYKNIALLLFVVAAVSVTFYFVNKRDKKVVDLWNRNKYTIDSIYTSPDERWIAIQFSDSILPALKQKGLIKRIEPSKLGTTIFVSGNMWKERSQFFKENFLKHLSIYNKVHGYSPMVNIYDQHSGRQFAKIFPPDRREVYE